jgi:hypothetical protein
MKILTPLLMWGFLFVGIGNIFLILQNSGVWVYRLLNNWKYISKTRPPFRKGPQL